MFAVNFTRALKFGWQNFWRNRWLSLVTVLILILTLFLISLIVTVKVVADKTMDSVENKVDFSIYFTTKTDLTEIVQLQERLENLMEVKMVEYVSPQQALSDFRDKHKNNETIIEALDSLDDNPLGAVLVVKAYNLDDYDSVTNIVQEKAYQEIIQDNDEDFESNKSIIAILSNITTNINQFGLVLSIIFATISFLVIFNTIRITIHSYREEIIIMKLVGASNRFVRAPFIINSVIYALIASIFCVVLIYSLINTIAPFLNNFFAGYELNVVEYFNQNFLLVFASMIIVSVTLCVISSIVAIRRYLRV